MYEYLTVNVEGEDQVGKGDAVFNLCRKYCEYGIDSTIVSLPYYSTPLGYALRKILTDGFEESILLEPEEELDTKMSLFSLNRLEVLNAILSKLQEGVYIFDRGPFSNALTIGYALIGNHELYNIEDLVERALDYDTYFRKVLNIDNCVIKLESKEVGWVASRQDRGDLHERRDVQERSREVYKYFEKKIGEGWKNIVTKDSNGWRSREDISTECFDFANSRLGIIGKRYRPKRNIVYLGIEDIAHSLYKGSCIGDEQKCGWSKALKNNDKEAIYALSKGISENILETFKEIKWYNEEIKGEVRRILSLNPSLLCVFESMYGENFLLRFLRSLDD